MTRASIELVRAERRRRWTRSEKERLVAASFEPGVSASEVARAAGIHVSQLFRWRNLLCERVASPAPVPALVPVAVLPPPLTAAFTEGVRRASLTRQPSRIEPTHGFAPRMALTPHLEHCSVVNQDVTILERW